ncbi:CsbD family protein [Leptolyngbya sp. AN02str]|uniref:CsbD family protein n=1 Tax=Leptolyngbya sp. AN02str TaxID=3423363 RepID=UPI003D3204D5
MSAQDRVKATAKNLEGKAQEALGDVTGDPNMKAEGQAKQAEAQLRHTAENVKDTIKDSLK